MNAITQKNIVLLGLGAVNLTLLKILIDKEERIRKEHFLQFIVVGVSDSSGFAVAEDGYSFQELIDLKAEGKKVKDLPGYVAKTNVAEIANFIHADLLVDGSPVNLETGNPGLSVATNILQKKWSVVFANKAPLVLAYDALHQLAEENQVKLAFSATVCGGLPVINILQRDLPASNLLRVTGIFNATSNFILDELKNDKSLADAIKVAQDIGAAEADPSLDIEGYDTANKLFIVMKSFTDFSGSLEDISIEGIQNVPLHVIKEADLNEEAIKLLALAERKQGKWQLSVRPTAVKKSSFLGSCTGWEMGIQLETDLYKNLAMKLYEDDPVPTSAAVLRDIISVCS